MKTAAVAFVRRCDGRILVVWNGRYGGWSLPGGMVERGETEEAAMWRELREETGLIPWTEKPVVIFDGDHGLKAKRGRATRVVVYHVSPDGNERETEIGRPVTWLEPTEFLRWSPFAPFYRRLFRRAAFKALLT